MILLTGLYLEADPDRYLELLECVRRNHESGLFERIVLWVQEPVDPVELVLSHPFLADRAIRLIIHERRLTYRNLFEYSNHHLTGRRVAIANTDIFFDETLELLNNHDLSGKLLCLSRWDVQVKGTIALFDHPSSQDAWIFQAPIQEFSTDFHMGVPGCDNRLAFEARNAGLEVFNPAKSVRACHLHLSGVRHYNERDRICGPAYAVPAEELDELPSRERVERPAPSKNGQNACSESIGASVVNDDTIIAVTSLSPALWRVPLQKACVDSWRNAGLQVCSFNHPSEIAVLNSRYDIDWVPVEKTSADVFGGHYIPVKVVADWAAQHDVMVLLVNADIEFRMTPWEIKRIRWLAHKGLAYFVRHNHSGDLSKASPEPYGIDAFMFHGRDTVLPNSFLSMGQPFWDYLLPHLFAVHGRHIWVVDFPAAFHRQHGCQWSWENWHRCANEFGRITGLLGSEQSMDACVAMSLQVRQKFDRGKASVPAQPRPIREWVERKFRNSKPKIFLELGSHVGTDTEWMAALEHVTIHAFEPDPRNNQPVRSNVIQHRLAVGVSDGCVPFILSESGWGQRWTHSSSTKKPKNHLHRYPVIYGDTTEVQAITLDTYCRSQGLELIDFIWADIEGAEGDMIRGGQRTLKNTRYLFTEYSDDELYEGQASLREIVNMLPDFRVVELWPDDVLLENRALAR